MPSSFAGSFLNIVNLLVALDPKRVVDVGPGWGKYGLACREYLPKLERLDAVEVPQGRKPTQDAIYDSIAEIDLRALPATFWEPYDVALLIDVVEHVTLPEGRSALRDITEAGVTAVVATPKRWIEQHDKDNPHETHLSLWRWTDLAPFGIYHDRSTPDAIVYALRKL